MTHRPIIALGIFALLTSDGNRAQANHVSAGEAGGMVTVADVLDAMYRGNRRLRAVPALANRFRNGVTYPILCVRLAKTERRVLVDAIADLGQFMPRTTRARKLADLLASFVCVY